MTPRIVIGLQSGNTCRISLDDSDPRSGEAIVCEDWDEKPTAEDQRLIEDITRQILTTLGITIEYSVYSDVAYVTEEAKSQFIKRARLMADAHFDPTDTTPHA